MYYKKAMIEVGFHIVQKLENWILKKKNFFFELTAVLQPLFAESKDYGYSIDVGKYAASHELFASKM